MTHTFYKFQGTGNDFVIFDNRDGALNNLTNKQVKHLCDRRFGIGADGLMLLSEKEGYDFEMIYYNSDGNPSTMCGNGGRCLVKFASLMGIHKYTYRFVAVDGPHEADIDNTGMIRLKMKNVDEIDEHTSYAVLNTGSPHYVKFVSDIHNIDVVETGRDIRNSKPYAAEGINVNFLENTGEDSIYVRTYERGVEDETYSCGTGVTAASLVSAHNQRGFNRIEVQTPGGNLSVEYTKLDETHFENIWLCGPAVMSFKGEVEIK
ncbi:MAG: diaminopimelate epimerase [Ferruginibacter sp.]